MNAPRVISLDLDDTLWPAGPLIAAAEAALLSWLREHHPRAALGLTVDSMRNLRDRVAERFPQKSYDLTFLRRQALAEMFETAGYPEGPAADDAFEIFLSERNRVEFYSDVRPALERLHAKYRLFALSNGNADLERCGIAHLFDGHVTASAAGAAKPDARIFAHLLRTAGVPPIDVLHVGDDPLADVVGAAQAGMQAVWLNRDAKAWPAQFAPPARTITTLADIL